MRGSLFKGVVLGSVCSALVFVASSALAGSGVGGVFNLGVSNSVDAKTTLTGASPAAQLQVTNTNGAAGASGLGVSSASSTSTGFFNNTGAGTGLFAQTGGATKTAVYAKNTGGGPAGAFVVNAGVAPFTVSSSAKVANLNADLFDGLNSTAFLRNQVPLTLTGAVASDGVSAATNTGNANGVQGKTGSSLASGVYGENTGGGYGVAGRTNSGSSAGVYGQNTAGGVGVFGLSDAAGGIGVKGQGLDVGVVGINTAYGAGGRFVGNPALELDSFNYYPPMSVNSSARVDFLNADKVDGASIFSNRIISTTANDHILQVPGFGDFNVGSCDHTNARFEWATYGGNAYVTWFDLRNPDDTFYPGDYSFIGGYSHPRIYALIQLARGTGASTSIATITVSANAVDCVFAAQAVVQPG
jgi:hypothetical protein